ncbi:unnamed protein product [Sphagnum jensenii]|uniref:Uncharacterized protein n=1 Tax=Sphagnum jensenii TaxID=128206 RepID=A0ABP0WFT1_9BRYO
MLDTVGPELQVLNNNDNQAIAIDLQQGETIILTPDKSKPASSNFLPINYADLAFAVKPGDEIFVGQYLFTGSEATSVWLEVMHTQGDDVHCYTQCGYTHCKALDFTPNSKKLMISTHQSQHRQQNTTTVLESII